MEKYVLNFTVCVSCVVGVPCAVPVSDGKFFDGRRVANSLVEIDILQGHESWDSHVSYNYNFDAVILIHAIEKVPISAAVFPYADFCFYS